MSLLAQDDQLTRRVGAATIVVIAAAIAFFVFLSGSIGGSDSLRFRVFLHHAGGLKEGAPLVVAGQPVGAIETIARSPKGAPGPLNGDEGIVAVVAIERAAAARISRGGDMFVASHGILSDRYLELGMAPEVGVPYREGEDVLGRDPPSLDRVLQRTWNNLMIAKAFADAVRPGAQAFAAELATLADNLAATLPETMIPGDLAIELTGLVAEARRLRDTTLGGADGLARIDAVIGRGRRVVAQARAALDTLSAHATALSTKVDGVRSRMDPKTAQFIASLDLAIARGKAALDKIDPLLAQIQAVNDRLARGEGSIGRLMRDPEFPEDAKELGKILKRQPWKIISRPHD